MASKSKSKPAPKSKPKTAAKPASSPPPSANTNARKAPPSPVGSRHLRERLANARKIGSRQETITVLLSPSQVEEERAKVCSLHRDLDRVEGDLKTISSGHKARIREIKASIATAVMVANAAKRDEEITIEEWLTGRNEVIRVRTDTQEIIGNRIAKVDELQEELELEGEGGEDDDDDDGDDDDDKPTEGNGDTPPESNDFGEDKPE